MDRRQLLAQTDLAALQRTLERRIALPTESQNRERAPELRRYLEAELAPELRAMGFACELWDNPVPGAPPLLFAERLEDPALPTVLSYGHGDVVLGDESKWTKAASPWTLERHEGRWYGRGVADNKGQHSLNLQALAQVLAARGGRLGFNSKFLFEMGEEVGSPGLKTVCERQRERLRADLFLASDGPRLNQQQPTLFLGSRGVMNFELALELREGAHHSGNWGGLLANPGVLLAGAIHSIVDQHGVIRVEALRPPPLPAAVRAALADVQPGEPGGPAIDGDWGEPGLSPAERVFGWNSIEVLAFRCGNPDKPVNAIPPRAQATMQIRFVVGRDPASFLPALRAHLDAQGYAQVQLRLAGAEIMNATRLDPDSPWVRWAQASLRQSTGQEPVLLPNLGGSLPNDCFAEVLGLPTVWVPHSVPTCSQHAPNEHLPEHTLAQGLQIMAGLFWDLGEGWPAGTGRAQDRS
ncbi:M20 family metallopeptidase [Kinneretia asaccharophila]|uniref:Acetylornithine deacetylase/succinyl-diaminopimelate desuccinylase-like protein n=1 Tax=Roseateles asaccharophilus TaxID=582607 RepID=A0A4R6NCJ3_9BURK|nr:M20 family metallopeptidase [Roseateles asaccharophilus]MDN3545193.1 M20 family metallopeptidase [Roseateles asaccharophilus]TDP11420.1 acetylornithine deacetylase/succinyl-diaminopimelate desuccinylase-like protein [Roseateles asaccharophilus]